MFRHGRDVARTPERRSWAERLTPRFAESCDNKYVLRYKLHLQYVEIL